MTTDRGWGLRTVPTELAARYRSEGWWRDETLGQMVAEGLSRCETTPFVVHSRMRPWRGTFADIDRSARTLAGNLQRDGVGPGDVVVLQMPNWVEAGIAFWAAAYLGAVVVPVVHFYGAKELAHILRTTQPDVLVTVDRFGTLDHLSMHTDLVDEHPVARWLVVGEASAGALPAAAQPFASRLDGDPIGAPLAVDPDAPTLIGFTSGTTRDPKGVIHSHNTIGCEARQLDGMSPGFGPPPITGAPVGHFIGMLNAFLVPLLRERAVHLLDVWDPGEVLRLMVEEDLSMGGGATYFLTSVLDHPDFTEQHLARMPFAGLGGSTVPVAVTQRATDLGILVYRSYGSTEHPSITGGTIHDPLEKRLETDGDPMEGVEIKLDGEGQIISRGPDLCIGYTDPELTAKVFDDEGWYHTGDVGVLDADGYLAITDRLSDVIIRGGENISAQEIEEEMLGLPGVAEVCVVAAPDERLGERAAALVRLREGAPAPTLDDVRAHLAQVGLAKQKWPEILHVVDDLPRTPSGKVQKFRLRQQLRDEALGPSRP